MAKYLMVDPPGGWQKGFPKVLGKVFTDDLTKINFNEYDMILNDLLDLNGYSKSSRETDLKHTRYWIAEFE